MADTILSGASWVSGIVALGSLILAWLSASRHEKPDTAELAQAILYLLGGIVLLLAIIAIYIWRVSAASQP